MEVVRVLPPYCLLFMYGSQVPIGDQDTFAPPSYTDQASGPPFPWTRTPELSVETRP